MNVLIVASFDFYLILTLDFQYYKVKKCHHEADAMKLAIAHPSIVHRNLDLEGAHGHARGLGHDGCRNAEPCECTSDQAAWEPQVLFTAA